MSKIKPILSILLGILGMLGSTLILAPLGIIFSFLSIRSGYKKIGFFGIVLAIFSLVICFTSLNSYSGIEPYRLGPIAWFNESDSHAGMSHKGTPCYGSMPGVTLPGGISAGCSTPTNGFNSFDEWWNSEGTWRPQDISGVEPLTGVRSDLYQNELGISKNQFQKFPLSNGTERGDLLIAMKTAYDEIKVGDVIIYKWTTSGGHDQLNLTRVIKKFNKDGINYIGTLSDFRYGGIGVVDNVPYSPSPHNNNPISADNILYKVTTKISKIATLSVWLSEQLMFLPAGF